MKKIHITSLGCAKNLVDSDVLGGQLKQRQYTLTSNPSEAELIIVNTCGFIEEAKKESIQAIFEAIEFKNEDKAKQVFVTGCLSQRYREELIAEIPAIDAIFGTEDYEQILSRLGENSFHPEEMYKMRDLTTPGHFAYLKISEGCNHSCAFCAIPGIRGKHRSRKIENIIAEAKILADRGVKELILVSQDTSYYGNDMYHKSMIVDLLSKIADEDMFRWIRPLYWYPSNFPVDFIHLMNKYETIVPYLDMPIQHASDHVLRLMRRAEKNENLLRLYKKIKEIRPDIALRTTFILGHPGETKDDFEKLKEFIELVRFDRVGAFVYSDEEGTSAYDLPDKVDKDKAQNRYAELMMAQARISNENNNTLIESIQNVLIDGYDQTQKYYHGRTYRDAPEIDNEVIISYPAFKEEIIGSFTQVKITNVSEHELYGHFNVNL
jgi:ribosomal protein S12 methylthiotransferase